MGLMADAKYLEVTYDEARVPRGSYPAKLARWVASTCYAPDLRGCDLRVPGRLLDLGCGRGEFLGAFADLGMDVAGVDASPLAPKLAPGRDVRVADMERDALPFEPGSFDFVFSKSVIEHMRDPMGLFSMAMTALRPGGIAVIMTPSWQHNCWGPFYIDHTHVTPFTEPSLENAMEMAGFEASRAACFYQLPFTWGRPFLMPVVWAMAALPLPYRPYNRSAPWPESVNKLIRFSKEAMLLGVGRRPGGPR
jgi:SAM-dependent methyltransferase